MRFGDFLLARKLVTEDALNQALELQRVYHRPLGKCAEDLGYITRRENVAILLKQLKFKKRYGDVALEMGIGLIVPLPMPQAEYEQDFSSPTAIEEFRDSLKNARAQ